VLQQNSNYFTHLRTLASSRVQLEKAAKYSGQCTSDSCSSVGRDSGMCTCKASTAHVFLFLASVPVSVQASVVMRADGSRRQPHCVGVRAVESVRRSVVVCGAVRCTMHKLLLLLLLLLVVVVATSLCVCG
jgi:hypothetical protein